MDKVQKPNSSVYYTWSSEPFRFQSDITLCSLVHTYSTRLLVAGMLKAAFIHKWIGRGSELQDNDLQRTQSSSARVANVSHLAPVSLRRGRGWGRRRGHWGPRLPQPTPSLASLQHRRPVVMYSWIRFYTYTFLRHIKCCKSILRGTFVPWRGNA
jgi:hypothetical protein